MAEKDREHIRRLREEANAIRKQEQAKRRRNRVLAQVGIVVGALVVIGLIVGAVVFGPQLLNPRPDFSASGQTQVTSDTGAAVDQPITTTDRGVLVGAADAPVSIEYWYDYSCPHCVQYHQQMDPTFQQLLSTGQIKIEYIPINYVAPYGAQAGAAVLATMQYQPELYFAVSDGLFSIPSETQQSWGASDYASILSSFGVTSPEALAAVSEGSYVKIINDSTRDARSGGVNGTPSIAINGEMQSEIPTPATIYDLVNAAGGNVTAPAATPAETPAA